MAFTGQNPQAQPLNHLGLVGALCEQLSIADRVNQLLGPTDPQRVVSPGHGVVAMILNGLGFSNHRLYLTSSFFENKPVKTLFNDESIEANQLTEHALGRTLDDIADYGCTQFFANVAYAIALENNLLGSAHHLDSTSFQVHGDYANQPEEPERITITRGYSKDHRPDLKQVVLSMMTNGPADVPIWIEALDGNSSDKTSFHKTMATVHEFQSQIDMDRSFHWVADSALYHKEKLLHCSDLWLTRVPETVAQAKALVRTPEADMRWRVLDNGYKIHSLRSDYGDMKQRWLLVYSEQAFAREKNTFEGRLEKERQGVEKTLRELSKQAFACEHDAQSALKKTRKSLKHFTIDAQIVPISGYKKRGRPRHDETPSLVAYQIQGTVLENASAIEQTLNTKGRFILATNDLDDARLSDEGMLETYKSQQGVERGFRFFKDPWFMADKVFLKSTKRIQALMVIMGLSLLVYNFGQYQLRERLKKTGETLPNQKRKEIQNPTLRWVFQMMIDITVLHFDTENEGEKKSQTIVMNIGERAKRIIHLFGDTARRQYGISIADNTT